MTFFQRDDSFKDPEIVFVFFLSVESGDFSSQLSDFFLHWMSNFFVTLISISSNLRPIQLHSFNNRSSDFLLTGRRFIQ